MNGDLITYQNYLDVPKDLWRWRYFTPQEMACRGTNVIVFSSSFMDQLESIRIVCGFPFLITSGYRTPEHNMKVSSTGPDGPHTTALAVDIGVYGHRAYELISVAIMRGFTGIGVSQKGPREKRFIHLDIIESGPYIPRPWIWSY